MILSKCVNGLILRNKLIERNLLKGLKGKINGQKEETEKLRENSKNEKRLSE